MGPIRSMAASNDGTAVLITDGTTVTQLILRDTGLFDASPQIDTLDTLLPILGGDLGISMQSSLAPGPIIAVAGGPTDNVFYVFDSGMWGGANSTRIRLVHRAVSFQNCSSYLHSDTAVCVLSPLSGAPPTCSCGSSDEFIAPDTIPDNGLVCAKCTRCSGANSAVGTPCNGTSDTVCVPGCGALEVQQYTAATVAADSSTQGSVFLTPGGSLQAITALYITPRYLGAERLVVGSLDTVTGTSNSAIFSSALPGMASPPIYANTFFLNRIIGDGTYGSSVSSCTPATCSIARVGSIGATLNQDAVWLQFNQAGSLYVSFLMVCPHFISVQ